MQRGLILCYKLVCLAIYKINYFLYIGYLQVLCYPKLVTMKVFRINRLLLFQNEEVVILIEVRMTWSFMLFNGRSVCLRERQTLRNLIN